MRRFEGLTKNLYGVQVIVVTLICSFVYFRRQSICASHLKYELLELYKLTVL